MKLTYTFEHKHVAPIVRNKKRGRKKKKNGFNGQAMHVASAAGSNGCCIHNQPPIFERAKFESLILRSDTSSLFQEDDSNLFPRSRHERRADCTYMFADSCPR